MGPRAPFSRSSIVVGLLGAVVALAVDASPARAGIGARELDAEVKRLCTGRTLWPGFDPLEVPLAVFDGKQTYLFRHPRPPLGFSPQRRWFQMVWMSRGRHPDLVANSSAKIGGVDTATVLLDGLAPGRSVTDLAGLTIHEMFHVYQGQNHPSWRGNEAELFTYPVEDADLLALRRIETRALARALAAPDPEGAACWARRALQTRRERFARLAAGASDYERGTELNEGLATYVEFRATDRKQVELPESGYAPEDVRERAYETGTALALLLDRLAPDWQKSLSAGEEPSLDELLARSLAAPSEGAARGCSLSDGEREEIESRAGEDAAAVLERRVERRAAFDSLAGWRVVVEAAEGSPLWPQGFDPLNVDRVDGGVLHTRFLKLGNEAGHLELMNGQAFTEAAGAHPLNEGVRRVVVAGLEEPRVLEKDGATAVRAPGLAADFTAARIERQDGKLIVRLGDPGE